MNLKSITYIILQSVLLLFYSHISISQTLVITAKDKQNHLQNEYSVFKNSHFIGRSTDYIYYLNCSKYDTITVKKDGLTSDNYIVESDDDTLKHLFVIYSKFLEIEEVEVSYEKYIKMAGEKNENIIDFYFYPENQTFLLLKSIRNNYYIEKKSDVDSKTVQLGFKAEELFLDALGNTHILSKDSAYQIWFQDSLNFVTIIDKNLFNLNIRYLVSKNDSYIFYENFTQHNQCYILSKTDSDNNISTVNECFDKVAFDVAKDGFNEIITLYYMETTPMNNIILNGVWDGNLTSLAETWQLANKIVWYQNIRAKPIDCKTFGMLDQIVLINRYENYLHKYDDEGSLIEKIGMENIDLKNNSLIYDYFYDNIYQYGINKGAKKELYKLDLNNGKMNLVAHLKEVEPNHIKVVGNEVFFLARNDAGFNKLYRMYF